MNEQQARALLLQVKTTSLALFQEHGAPPMSVPEAGVVIRTGNNDVWQAHIPNVFATAPTSLIMTLNFAKGTHTFNR